MISVYISIVLFCFQWLFKPYISKLLCQLIFRLYCSLHRGFESWLHCRLHLWAKLRYVHKNKRCWNHSSVCLCCPVSGLIPDLKRSDGSFPQASCQLSLVSPVNRELKGRVPVECSNRYKVEKLSANSCNATTCNWAVYSYFEKGCRKKCSRQSRKALWVVLSSLFFKEIWKNWHERPWKCVCEC